MLPTCYHALLMVHNMVKAVALLSVLRIKCIVTLPCSKLHACKACGQPAEHGSKEGELVPCRRCPQAWHRRCLPQDLPLARDSPPVARVWLADYDEETGGFEAGCGIVFCGCGSCCAYCDGHRALQLQP